MPTETSTRSEPRPSGAPASGGAGAGGRAGPAGDGEGVAWPAGRREALEKGLAARVAALRDDVHPRLLEAGPARERAERLHAAEGVGDPYDVWCDVLARRVAVLWVLKSLYVRVLEDRGLIGARIASEESQRLFEHLAPHLGETAYLAWVYRDLAQEQGGLPELFARQAAEVVLPGDEASQALLAFWREVDPDTGDRRWSFDQGFDTRLIGDLYEQLDPVVRERFALCQTPWFVEAFMLDRTLDPALAELGVAGVRLLDPACGSGHFLVGAFRRLARAWQALDGSLDRREVARRALAQVVGIDINDYACALSRFRLLLAAFEVAGITRLEQGSQWAPQVFCADALVQHEQAEERQAELFPGLDETRAAVLGPVETSLRLKQVLAPPFSVVVANPPYIQGKDPVKRDYYRERYQSCHGKFQLVAPFTERCFQLARPGGWVGLFNGNGFMKRNFGVPLIKGVLAKNDLELVIDCSGVYFGRGYGTPTVILFARRRPPSGPRLRAVLGRRGEPSLPEEPSEGLVWSAVAKHIDAPFHEDEYVTIGEVARATFDRHPWSLGGGGASEIKERLDEGRDHSLGSLARSIGFASFTGQDEAFVAPRATLRRTGVPDSMIKDFVHGQAVRDWGADESLAAFAPYREDFSPLPLDPSAPWAQRLWPLRTSISSVVSFGGKTRAEAGDAWWTWYRWVPEKYRLPLSIAFAEVATHNHFVLDRGGKVFKQTAPVIKLAADATEDEHLGLLGLLNSSTIGFWMRQVCHDKGNGGVDGGIAAEAWERRHQFDGTKLKQAPLVEPDPRVLALARALDALGHEQARATAAAVVGGDGWQTAAELQAALDRLASARRARLERMVALQEELDWLVYELYGLLPAGASPHPDPDAIEPLAPGLRPFEVMLARRVAAGELETAWFTRHGTASTTALPAGLPPAQRARLERRLALIAEHKDVALIEQPEYKRRWQQPDFAREVRQALDGWLLDRVEAWARAAAGRPRAFTVAEAVRALEQDPRALAAASAREGRRDVDLLRLVTTLVDDESVPNNPRHRYTEQGLLKRKAWEQTWALQRREDAGERVVIPVPPRYTRKDFQRESFWSLRGALDVPKERFVAFAEARSPTGDAVFGWAGWDARQRAQALAALDEEAEDRDDPLEARCGALQGLWALLPDLARDHPKAVDEYQALASSACGQDACPCPVLEAWATRAAPARTPRRGRKRLPAGDEPGPARGDDAPAGEAPAKPRRPRKPRAKRQPPPTDDPA